MKFGLSTIIFLLVSITTQAQSFDSLSKKFGDLMCACIEKKHDGKEVTDATMNTYFEYCKGFVFVALKEDIKKLESTDANTQQRLVTALSTKFMTDCPFIFPHVIGEEINNKIKLQCEEQLIPILEADKYSKEICSCFTTKYLRYMGTDSRMVILLAAEQSIDVDANYPLTVQAIRESIGILYDQGVFDTEFAIGLERKLFKLSAQDDPAYKGINPDDVYDCLYSKQMDYMFDNMDVEIEDWPENLEQEFLDACLKEVKEK